MIQGFTSFLRTNSGKDLLYIDSGVLRYLNSTSWDPLESGLTGTKDFSFATVAYNDKLYFCNEDNVLRAWDRGATTFNGSMTASASSVPHGNVLVWHKNHMFTLNNVTYTGTTYANDLYWSDFGDPSSWDTSTQKVNLPGGGRLITACDWGDVLVIGKEHSFMFLTGYGDSDWAINDSTNKLENVDEAVGIISPKGITRVGDEIWFIDDEAQIRRLYKTSFDAFRRDIVSTKIQSTLANINKAYLYKAVAWTYNDKVYFAVPYGSDTYNSLVLVYDLIASKRTGEEAWTTYTGWNIDFADAYPTSTTPDLYLADSRHTQIYKHVGYDDAGIAIDSRWDSKQDDFDNPDEFKRYKKGYIHGEAGASNVDVEIAASVGDATFADLGNLNLAAVGGTLGPTGTFALGPTGTTAVLVGSATGEKLFYYSSGGGKVTGRSITHSIRHDEIGEQPTVYGFTCHYGERT